MENAETLCHTFKYSLVIDFNTLRFYLFFIDEKRKEFPAPAAKVKDRRGRRHKIKDRLMVRTYVCHNRTSSNTLCRKWLTR